MMDECAQVCFLPDWKDSNGAMYEYGRAAAQGKPFFFFEQWHRATFPEDPRRIKHANCRANGKRGANQPFPVGRVAQGTYPELKRLYHIPNGGFRNKATAGRSKRRG